ncbi:MAG: UDP-N-acetylmuramoylalanyl-D-glutamate--2,6-diaminopimelate ligase, partial [Peptoniphilus harei]|nr:UDP-N-acetylmuramoylalanyl-D-glutamate--2,6-diaminopimelate ligase [Peptoniphilus harei]
KEKDRVTDEELKVFKGILEKNKIDCKVYDTLEESINDAIDLLDQDDVLLLAGCQGMDKGAGFVKEKLLIENKVKDIQGFSHRIDKRIC